MEVIVLFDICANRQVEAILKMSFFKSHVREAKQNDIIVIDY